MLLLDAETSVVVAGGNAIGAGTWNGLFSLVSARACGGIVFSSTAGSARGTSTSRTAVLLHAPMDAEGIVASLLTDPGFLAKATGAWQAYTALVGCEDSPLLETIDLLLQPTPRRHAPLSALFYQ